MTTSKSDLTAAESTRRVIAIILERRDGDTVRDVRTYPVADASDAAYLAACRKARAAGRRIDEANGRGCTGTRLIYAD